jgi:hypothetical protein
MTPDPFDLSAIARRDEFLKKAFTHYMDPKTKGEIIGGK